MAKGEGPMKGKMPMKPMMTKKQKGMRQTMKQTGAPGKGSK